MSIISFINNDLSFISIFIVISFRRIIIFFYEYKKLSHNRLSTKKKIKIVLLKEMSEFQVSCFVRCGLTILINSSPYGEGWLIEFVGEMDPELMSEDDYLSSL